MILNIESEREWLVQQLTNAQAHNHELARKESRLSKVDSASLVDGAPNEHCALDTSHHDRVAWQPSHELPHNAAEMIEISSDMSTVLPRLSSRAATNSRCIQ